MKSELIARSDAEVRWLGVIHPCSWTSMNLVGQLSNSHRAPIGTPVSPRGDKGLPPPQVPLSHKHLWWAGASMNGRADSRLPSAAQP